MDAVPFGRSLVSLAIATAGVIGLPARGRAQQASAAPAAAATAVDTASLIEHAAAQARVVAARLDSVAVAQSGKRAPTDPSSTQYQNGLTQLLNGQCDAAYLLFRSAVAANPNKARNHGDLAFSLVCRQRLDDAAAEYATAVRLQSANPWYYVGLAAVRGAQERWTEAAANYTLALATDSTILYPELLDSASTAFQNTGNGDAILHWSQVGTRLFPNDADAWLRVSMMLRRRGDTGPEGLEAIRHFHALQPESRLGDAILSLYLSDAGQNDSALAYASLAASDSSLREYSSLVYLRIGAHLLQQQQFEKAAEVLNAGRDMAAPGNHARYSLYIAHANIQRAVPLFQDAVQKRNCAEGLMVDSILTTVDRDLHESMAMDSAQTVHILNDILPGFKEKVQEFKEQCR